MWTLKAIDETARYFVSLPLAFLGLGLTVIAKGLILTSAWIADVDLTEFDDE